MSSYATTAELENRYESAVAAAHITDNADAGTPDTTVLQEVLDDAEGQINSHLAGKYLVPVDVTLDAALDAFLRNITLDIAMWQLATVRQGFRSDSLQAVYEARMVWLEKVAEGKLHLPTALVLTGTSTVNPVADYGTGSDESDSERKFTRASQSRL